MKSEKILILGASGGSYGAYIANSLEAEGHEIFTSQRHPRYSPYLKNGDAARESILDVKHWCDGDLLFPENSITTISQLDSHDVILDTVICGSLYKETADFELITTFDLSHALRVNVIEPLMLIKFLVDFNRIKLNGKLIFFLDPRRFDNTKIHIEVSKAGLYSMTNCFLDHLPLTLQRTFLLLPHKEQLGSEDITSRHICDMISGVRPFQDRKTDEVLS